MLKPVQQLQHLQFLVCYALIKVKSDKLKTIEIQFLSATTSEAPSPTTITTDESTKSPNPSTTMNSSPMTTQAPFDGKILKKKNSYTYTVFPGI